MDNERKVIPLNAKFKSNTIAATPGDVRAAATGTVAFILLLMVGFNFSMFEVKRSKQLELNQRMQRGIASVPRVIEPQWRRNLDKMDASMVSKSAARPTLVDTLNFGVFEGNYSLKIEDGKVTNIAFANDKSEPKTVNDRMGFIQKYAGAFAADFKAIEKMRVEKSQAGFKETYKVDTAQGSRVFEVEIDGQNRLLSLNITK